ncbi:hypothetical protein EXN66_Car017865 [Channa argus]|uniref:Uncharacterized protein n=1 Tax=Channa argus TaxID=215402 RepID=A0A6G1QI83_CHAAH|nr:hypothetical protein EXN66_Car017865 [Channa argus]
MDALCCFNQYPFTDLFVYCPQAPVLNGEQRQFLIKFGSACVCTWVRLECGIFLHIQKILLSL